MNKNKKNYNKIFGLSLLVFICFSFFVNITTVIAYFEYQNPGEIQTQICGYDIGSVDDCNARLKTVCGADTPGSCVFSTTPCNNSMADVICPTPDVQKITGQKTTGPTDVYTLLAPIGELKTAPTNIGDYFNTIFLIAIGLCGALAVIMIVIGGVQYMGDESIFSKTEAKSKIMSAILGLLIALGAYALLNTINPDLLGKGGVNVKQVSAAIINLPDAGDSSVDPNFKTGNGSYSMGSISPGVTSAVAKLQQGWTISGFQVSSANNTMSINIKSGNGVDTNNVISIAHGGNGYAEVGQGVTGDRKTPKGTWTILSMTTPGNGVPIYNRTGSNMGASYWLLSAMNSGERGIGIHGSQSGTTNGATAGCIRLTNADILALLPYIKTGIQVVVT